jgi:hypothetical protein
LEIQSFGFLKRDVPRHLLHADGEVGTFHLARQSALQSLARAFKTDHRDLVFWIVRGHEKRKALDVVPVRVRNEHVEADGAALEFRRQGTAQSANAAA